MQSIRFKKQSVQMDNLMSVRCEKNPQNKELGYQKDVWCEEGGERENK